MSGGSGGGNWRGGSGGFMNQFISPAAAGMGPNQYGSGMMNGGPQANYNGFNIGNKIPFKGGTTSEQMQKNVLDYWAAERAASGEVIPSMSNSGLGTTMDPRRSPDVAAPWRINQPYEGPVTGNVQPPNPTGYYPYGANASAGSAPATGGYDPMASPSAGGAPMQTGDASMPYWGATATGKPNMYAGGNPNFNERAPYQGLLGRGSYR